LKLRLHHAADVIIAQAIGHVVPILNALLPFALGLNNVVIVQHLHHARLIPTQEDVRAFEAIRLGASFALAANGRPAAALDGAVAGRLVLRAVALRATVPRVPQMRVERVVRVARSLVVSEVDVLVVSEVQRGSDRSEHQKMHHCQLRFRVEASGPFL
jgi:hypothetical protein